MDINNQNQIPITFFQKLPKFMRQFDLASNPFCWG